MELIISSVIGLLLGAAIVFAALRIHDSNKKASARAEADRILSRAKSEAAKIKKESENKAKDFESRARKNVEQEIHKQRTSLKNKEQQLERRLKEVEDTFKQKTEENERFLQQLKDREEKLQIAEARLKELEKKSEEELRQLRLRLEGVAQLSQEEAKRQLISAVEEEAKLAANARLVQIEEEATKEADRRARRVIAQALARFASEYTSERTVSVMALPSDEVKGKIIGREGRNIRTIEANCGVDLIVDDTPEAVVISGFDPVRRELARMTITKLIEDGRVHPARIEEVAEKARAELMKNIKAEGERVLTELGIPNMHAELVKLIGSLKYRMSHGQNVLNHSLEVAYISGLIAGELGVNPKTARRAGILHDIGMAIDHTVEGDHSTVGAEAAKKYGESDEIVHCIRAHHEIEKPSTILAWICLLYTS
ncbi:MAG: ribonuclease Y, partial [Bdellovibrionaceae bacterium]|nr:ribonuclease Y [Pseudobdellovibrionaceae bacterium]